MKKVLRSLIQERFPFEFRVEIELLSRRKDLKNPKKQAEIFNLLRKYGIDDVTKLGPGTNRYAFKMDGYVVKVATDNDGKIDNMKEFKMSKRLYPHVTKTYEVSDNGTLLVAEYIPPFASYTEMLRYADKIREILTKFSSVYLIGDVGINDKNYANWGLRIGDDENPVCLDYAYVYDVNSDLFMCRKCKNNSMLVPDKNFVELICPAKGCGAKYEFADIRRRLGNDVHRHEIGDLSEEGYKLTESKVLTELTVNRSNYLAKTQKKKQKDVDSIIDEEPVENDTGYIIDVSEKEERIMKEINLNDASSVLKDQIITVKSTVTTVVADNDNIDDDIPVINATATTVVADEEEDSMDIPAEESIVVNKPMKAVDPSATLRDIAVNLGVPIVTTLQQKSITVDADEDQLAFSGDIVSGEDDQEEDSPFMQEEEYEDEFSGDIPGEVEVEPEPEETVAEPEPEPLVNEIPTVEAAVEVVKADEDKKEHEVEPAENHDESSDDDDNPGFSSPFLKYTNKCISSVANKIGSSVHQLLLFDEVKTDIKQNKKFRIYPENFYTGIQNAAYHSLMTFLKFNCIRVPNKNGKGTHNEYTREEIIVNKPYTATMVFFARLWDSHKLTDSEDAIQMLDEYRSKYDDYQGIQVEWIEDFRARIKQKMDIMPGGIDKICDTIADVWCAPEETVAEPEPEPLVNEVTSQLEELSMSEDEMDEFIESMDGNPQETYKEEIDGIPLPEEITPEFISSMLAAPATQVGTSRNSENSGEDEEEAVEELTINDEEYIGDEGDDYINTCLMVTVYPGEGPNDEDVIRVEEGDEFGNINIPIYTKMSNVDPNRSSEASMVDDRNGDWDFLIHMIPDVVFLTENPDEYLEYNDDSIEESIARFVILDEREDGMYMMGIYYIRGLFVVDDNNDLHVVTSVDFLKKINVVIRDNIGCTAVSHLVLNTKIDSSMFKEEAYIRSILHMDEDDTDDVGDAVESEPSFDDIVNQVASEYGNDESQDPEPTASTPAEKNEAAPQVYKPLHRVNR